MHEFGMRLKELRKENGLTQLQVGERLSVSKALISSYESAARYPSYDVLIKLANLYGVTTDYLLGLDNRKMIDVSNLTPIQLDAVKAVLKSYSDGKK